MIITIHQPEHLPWTGFFHKMISADIYVYLDHVQFRKGYFHHRNKILTREGKEIWATVPLDHGSSKDSMLDKKIVNDFAKNYLSIIESSYKKCKYFEEYFDKLQSVVTNDHKNLVDLNIDLIDFFRDELEIKTPTVRSSDLNILTAKSEMNLDICIKLKADSYISGPSGLEYLDLSSFKDNNINVLIHRYIPPTYRSNNCGSGLSSLDLLFNEGSNSREIIEKSGNIENIF
jgi:hypothetical protein